MKKITKLYAFSLAKSSQDGFKLTFSPKNYLIWAKHKRIITLIYLFNFIYNYENKGGT